MAIKQTLQVTTTAKVDVKLAPKTRQMVVTRAEEHLKLAKIVREATARQKRIRKEVEDLFVKEKQGKALANGVDLDGFKMKMVCGTTRRLNKEKLVELGADPEWLEEAMEETPNEPYVKISAPGERD